MRTSDRPAGVGVGLKARHIPDILTTRPGVGWFEIHPENYMGAGGPPHANLARIRQDYPLSVHGVGLSLGGSADPDPAHLARLKAVVDRYEPGLVSEHLAWSTHRDGYFNDLLALPYTGETRDLVCAHIGRVQDFLGRAILLENPATYVTFETSTYDEIDFIAEIAARSGCGLLLDVNNVYVSCTNHGRDPEAYVDRFPVDRVGEIHLAGHGTDRDDQGRPLLIDAHDRPVADPVWALYARALGRAGDVPTLIEWDNDLPDWPDLFAETRRAETVRSATLAAREARHVA